MKLFPNIFGKKINDVEKSVDGSYWLMAKGDCSEDKSLMWYSLNNPVLCAVISARAKLFSQMKITHVNKNGDEIENSEILKALKQPNYFQSTNDFLFNSMWLMSVYGNDYIYYLNGLNNAPHFMQSLDWQKIETKEVLKPKTFLRTKQEIKDFEKRHLKYAFDEKEKLSIPISNVIPLYDLSNLKGGFRGASRVQSLKGVLNNIEENLKSKNVNLILSQKYIGTNKTSSDGQPQIQEEDRNNIKRALGNNSIQITNGNIEFNHLISDLKKLFLDEMFQQDAVTIVNAFESNIDVINYSLGNSTYSNQEMGIVRYIQNSIQTSADDMMNSFSSSFGLVEKGEKLVASFDHLPVMQVMLGTKLETYNKAVEGYSKAVENNLITADEAKEKLSMLSTKLGL